MVGLDVPDVSDQFSILDVVHAPYVFVVTVVIYVCNVLDAFADLMVIMILTLLMFLTLVFVYVATNNLTAAALLYSYLNAMISLPTSTLTASSITL